MLLLGFAKHSVPSWIQASLCEVVPRVDSQHVAKNIRPITPCSKYLLLGRPGHFSSVSRKVAGSSPYRALGWQEDLSNLGHEQR